VHRDVIENLSRFFKEQNLTLIGTVPSPYWGLKETGVSGLPYGIDKLQASPESCL
jgi:hypothetical protein